MGNMTLIIAEKPSVAGDLSKILPGRFSHQKTHYESDDTIITFAVGHLVTIAMPEEMDPIYKGWTFKNLPIIPEKFKLKKIDKSKAQLAAIGKLAGRSEVDTIINACDAEREGELIFKYILQTLPAKHLKGKTIKRLWLQSMTPASIKQAFNELRDDKDMKNLEAAAYCRSESDWLIGINASRAFTAYRNRFGGFFLTPCGRVQTPTLSMIVTREKERLSFVSKDYWELHATFRCAKGEYKGRWIDPDFKKDPANDHSRQERIFDLDKATKIRKKCLNKKAETAETVKPSKQNSPGLFDLTSLQREANSLFGLSASQTLSIAQALYERHKVVTYPRTSSRHLPEDYLEPTKKIFASISEESLAPFAREAIAKKYVQPDKKIFDDKKISDHHAIILTETSPKSLRDIELKIYHLIAQRFLAVFFPPAEYLVTRRTGTIDGQVFLTEGKVLKEPGWRAIYGTGIDSGDAATLPAIEANEKVECLDIAMESKQTRPPARYNEATLLSAMENCGKNIEDENLKEAMKEKGLGTPATRAAIIEGLLRDKYIARIEKDLTPTPKAFQLLEDIQVMQVEALASPELTGEWEYRLNQVRLGNSTREEFMKGIVELTCRMVDQVRNFDEDKSTRREADFSSVLGQRFFDTLSKYESEDGKIRIRKVLGGRRMGSDEILELLQKRRIGPFEDFVSKRGRPFTASLYLDDDDRVKFEFPSSKADEELVQYDYANAEPVGLSPIDQAPVYESNSLYFTKPADADTPPTLRINKQILGAGIPREQLAKMLRGEKTDLIKGFLSRKTKKTFDAFLTLDNTGKLKFEFPPRVAKGKGKGKGKGKAEKEATDKEGVE